jgi:mRNA interferase RelE/StbE
VSYSVQLSPHAVRAYQKLDPSVRSQVRAALDSLQQDPLTGSKIKRLKGQLREYLRYRTGDYRMVYTVDVKGRVVYVDYLQHRKDVYRQLE